jgi:putative DNA primase/helicase
MLNWPLMLIAFLPVDGHHRMREGTARSIAGYSHYSAIEKTARFRRSFRSKPNDWDRQPFLIGTPDGVVDIENGGRRLDPKREYYMTRSTLVAPADTSDGATQWHMALALIYRLNPEMIPFIQELGGYALTGDVREEIIPVAFGPGGNGKTVVFNTLLNIAATLWACHGR